jgi:hypothetical protein
VHVLVRVHMVELQTGGSKRLKLPPDFHRELASNSRQKEKSGRCMYHAPVELALTTGEAADLHVRQDGMPVDENEMQADPQIRQPTGARDGVSHRRGCNHQARGRKNTVPVCLLDGLVDRRVEPEIVRADDQAPQLAISRLRRN